MGVSLLFPRAQWRSFAHTLNQHAFPSTLNRSASIVVTPATVLSSFPCMCPVCDVSHWHHPSIERCGAH